MAFFDASTDLSGSGSEQGQLSSSYTSALTEYLQTDGADYVAFLAYLTKGLTIEDALLVKAEIEAGNFTLTDLFSAAQSKTGEVDGDDIDNPTPKLIVGDYVIDLTPMLTGTETYSWDSVTKKLTVTHTREYYTEGQEPTVDGVSYSEDWADPQTNVPPTATPIDVEIAEFDEYAASKDPEYNEDDAIQYTINLLSTANDDDGDTLSVVDGSVKLAGGGDLPAYITVDYETGVLTVDRNHPSFDELYLDDSWGLEIEYQITDDVNDPISNTVNLTITGTADQFTLEGTFSGGQTSGFNTTTWDGSFNVLIPTSSLVEGADAYFDFEGNVTVSATGDLGGTTEFLVVTPEGGESFTIQGDSIGPNGVQGQGGGDGSFTVEDSGEGSFYSTDASITISYDSNTANGNGGVDSIQSISAEITDVTYWA